MKVLVLGSGGREHALIWKIRQNPRVEKIYCLPGNAGIARLAEIIPGTLLDIEAIKEFVQRKKIDLTVVGPEAPLVFGIVDLFRQDELRIFGPDKASARLEGSKAFAKSFMKTYGIPTAEFKSCWTVKEAEKSIHEIGAPLVIKASGLAAGKGVELCMTESEAMDAVDRMMAKKVYGDSGDEVVVEKMLDGEEASIIAFCDGSTLFSLVPSQDHKRVFEGDKGPNTGGMGAYAPAPVVTPSVMKTIEEKVFRPFLNGINEKELDFRGVIYFGLMITKDGPKVLEFNVRLGDPEAQVQLPLLDADLVDCMDAVIDRRLKSWVSEHPRALLNQFAVCVVAASGGYPGAYKKGYPITGLSDDEPMIFHAGTGLSKDGIITTGGRVLGVTAVEHELEQAVTQVYTKISQIYFKNIHYRKDIAFRALERMEK